MSMRTMLGGAVGLVCLASLGGVIAQRNHLAGLRAERERLLAQTDTAVQRLTASSPAGETPQPGAGAADAVPVTTELLRLRSEVAGLTQRRRELEGLRKENDSLSARLADLKTNGAVGKALPAGYIRRAEARPVGYNTPEDTLQTFLWAFHNQDVTNLLQAFAPSARERLASMLQQSQDNDFFRGAEAIPGLGVVGRKDLPDGSVELTVEMVPGDSSRPLRFEHVEGQWKMASGL